MHSLIGAVPGREPQVNSSCTWTTSTALPTPEIVAATEPIPAVPAPVVAQPAKPKHPAKPITPDSVRRVLERVRQL